MIRFLQTLALLCCLTATLAAQTVGWQPAGGTLARGETATLDLVFEDCVPKETPRLPLIDGLRIGEASTSQRSSFNLINGSASRSSTVTVSYPVIATAAQSTSINIPALNVDTDKGRITASAVTFRVDNNTTGNIARARFLPPAGQIWAGQVFPLNYILEADKNRLYGVSENLDWSPAPLLVENWPRQPEQTEVVQNGVRTVRLTYRTLASAATAGPAEISAANQLISVAENSASTGFFGQPQLRRMLVTTEPVTLDIKPLPAPAPAGFTGIVGDFTLTARAVPVDAQVGEPITWTLSLSGTGNWPVIDALPSRTVSKDFRVVQPHAKRTPAREGALYEATLDEDVVLIPTAPGTHTLGPVSLIVFDPTKGEYHTLTTDKFTVNVTGATTPPPAATGNENTLQTASKPDARPLPPVPTKPAGNIPLDPLPDAPPAGKPLAPAHLLWLCIAPFVLPPILWIILGLRRSRQTDPARPLREARDRLAATLARIAQNPTPELVRAWRDDTARLWQLTSATPTPRDFPDPVWGALWAESERVLYRRDTAIAPQWIAQAHQALALHRVPGWSALQLFRVRNLFPWLTTLALLLVALPDLPAQTADYVAGDFATAGSAWRERIQKSPTDWSARHNLSLALAQQNRWDEAAAHAAIAWLHNPGSDATRWQLALAADRTPGVVAAFAPFVSGPPTLSQQIAATASPAAWQYVLIGSALLTAAALTLFILSGYVRFPPALVLVLLVPALTGAFAAVLALRAYAPLIARDTVLVWSDATLRSVPTEAAAEQQTTTVKAGTLATIGKDFLGWRQITLPDGQTGWLRATDITGLWTTP